MFLIRADGNAKIGAGHLMRCVAVAEGLAQLWDRRDICFVCADRQSAELAEAHGFLSHVLGTDYRDMESELPLWKELAAEKARSAEVLVLLIDSYYVTDRYLAALRQFGRTILMEDSGTHCYPVDCVINYNAPADLEAYQRLYQSQAVRLLIGSRYVPLRQQFIRTHQNICRSGQCKDIDRMESVSKFLASGYEESSKSCRSPYKVRSNARDVLITTGGGDIENIAGKILGKIERENFTFHLIIGQFSPHFQEMKKLESLRNHIHIYHNVSDMAGLMCSCDIALTAGGSTIYELAAVGVPFICFSYAENQELLTEYIGREHIAGYAGAWHRQPAETLERLAELFGRLADSQKMRIDYSQKERAMIDGRGAERLAAALTDFGTCGTNCCKQQLE